MPKLFLHKARDAPIVAILRRGEKRVEWELIEWNLTTDTFRAGQWLLGKKLNGKYPQLSQDGKYFAYHYDIYKAENWTCESAVSRLPNFTALYFCPEHKGNWEEIHFGEDGSIVFDPKRLQKKGDVEIPIRKYDKNLPEVPSSYIDLDESGNETWKDPRGRMITTKDGILYADGVVLYDTTMHAFEPREPI